MSEQPPARYVSWDEAREGDEPCHYCGLWVGVSRDHIVPMSQARPRTRREPPRNDNFVRACLDCNSRKGSHRILHNCTGCEAAWVKYGPDGWPVNVASVELKTITGRARGRHKSYVRSRPKSQRQPQPQEAT